MWNFKPGIGFRKRCETVCIMDGHFGKSAIFDSTHADKMVQSNNSRTLELYKESILIIWDAYHEGKSVPTGSFL